MISTLHWVPKGAAKAEPEQYELSPEDLKALQEKFEQQSLDHDEEARENKMSDDIVPSSEDEEEMSDDESEEEDEVEHAKAAAATMKTDVDPNEAFLKSLKLDEYDNEDGGAEVFLGGESLAAYSNNMDDPLLKHDAGLGDDDSDIEDMHLKPQDAVLLVGRSDEECNRLEVYVYEEAECNLFVHHDFEVPAFPLCMSWMDLDPRNRDNKGSFIAVGTFLPGIEIWNLDVIDVLEPVATLGGYDTQAEMAASKKKSKKAEPPILPGSHSDAVLSLSWNQLDRNRLASGSADSTIKLWDVCTQACVATLNTHKSKVQTVQFHATEQHLLLSSGFDQKACVTDLRTPDRVAFSFKLNADSESCQWNPHVSTSFAVSTEAGTVLAFDTRQASKPVFSLDAHTKACTSISFNQTIPNLLATTSLDNKIKLWDLSTAAPTLVTTKNAQVKSLFTLSYYRDSPFLLAAGGAAGKVVMWDTLEDPAVRSKYGPTYSTPAAIDVYVKAEADESAKAAAEATNPSTKKGNKKYPKTKKPESDDDD